MPSILCSNARAPVAQLVRASDRNSEDPGSNPGWISMSFFAINLFLGVCCLVCDIVHGSGRGAARPLPPVYFLNANRRTKNRQTYEVSRLRREFHALQVILMLSQHARLDAQISRLFQRARVPELDARNHTLFARASYKEKLGYRKRFN